MSDDFDALRRRAQIDQMREAAAPLARLLAAYHRELKDAGFTPDEALELIAQYQLFLVSQGTSTGGVAEGGE